MNETQLQDKLITLYEAQACVQKYSDEYFDFKYQIEEVQDDLNEIIKPECIATKQHFKMILSENGYDVCFNCGGKS